MSILREHGTAYLAMRRSLGYKLDGHGRLLMEFIGYLEDARPRHRHHRGSPGLGGGAGRRDTGLPQPAAVGGAVLRPLPVRLRPGLPGPAGRH